MREAPTPPHARERRAFQSSTLPRTLSQRVCSRPRRGARGAARPPREHPNSRAAGAPAPAKVCSKGNQAGSRNNSFYRDDADPAARLAVGAAHHDKRAHDTAEVAHARRMQRRQTARARRRIHLCFVKTGPFLKSKFQATRNFPHLLGCKPLSRESRAALLSGSETRSQRNIAEVQGAV